MIALALPTAHYALLVAGLFAVAVLIIVATFAACTRPERRP